MAISQVGSLQALNSGAGANSTGLTFTVPTGVTTGDLLVVGMACGNSINTPSGWVQYSLQAVTPTSGIWIRYADGTDVGGTTTYNFSITGTAKSAGWIIALRGVDTVSFLDATGAAQNTNSQTTASTTETFNALSGGSLPVTNGDYIMLAGFAQNASNNLTGNSASAISGYTKLADTWSTQASGGTSGNIGTVLFTATQTTAGTVASQSTTLARSCTSFNFTLALKPLSVTTASGSLTLSGTGAGTLAFSSSAAGSLTLTGSAASALKFNSTASGALSLTGGATCALSFPTTAAGSITLSGQALLNDMASTASGSISLTGQANALFNSTAQGGLTLNGTAVGRTGKFFYPPSTEYSYYSRERLWNFFRSGRHGISVIRWQDGTYSAIETLTTDEEAEASFIYYGGHHYTVTPDEADALTAAGFGAGITDDESADPPFYPAPGATPPGGGGSTPSGGYGTGGYGEPVYGG